MNEKQYFVTIAEDNGDFNNQVDFVFDDFIEVVKFIETCLNKTANKDEVYVKIGIV